MSRTRGQGTRGIHIDVQIIAPVHLLLLSAPSGRVGEIDSAVEYTESCIAAAATVRRLAETSGKLMFFLRCSQSCFDLQLAREAHRKLKVALAHRGRVM